MDDSFYDILASHYDDLQLTGDTSAWAPYICSLITDFCKKDAPSVTDLGCGTGVITNYLASKGIDVSAICTSGAQALEASETTLPLRSGTK